MPNNYENVNAQCPFFIDTEGRRVRCEGVVRNTTDNRVFKGNQRRKQHFEQFCCGEYRKCPAYRAVNEKYR